MKLRMRAVSLAALSVGLLLVGTASAQRPQTPVAAPPSEEVIAVAKREMAKPRTEPGYTAKRLAIGQPDLQGVWSNASNTRLTRPGNMKSLVMSDEENLKAQASNPQNIRQKNDDNQNADTKFDGKDLASGRGYNAFWIDPGTSYGNVKGTWRTSWIVDPPSGQIPFSKEGLQKQTKSRAEFRRGTGYNNPEERSLGERCIVQPTAGPPIGQYLYNNLVRISQSPDHVVLEMEMIHDVRIIRLANKGKGDKSMPDVMDQWMGDSLGHWEGDTLVVETRNIKPEQAQTYGVFLTEKGKITERFTRYNDRQVLYEFEISDPSVYSQVWKAEMALNQSADMYEYACHEGNYGLHGILAGGRNADKSGRKNDESLDRSE